MGKTTATTKLQKHWVHSHEEDTETETVYRPDSFDFPPSRGRTSFDIRSDGTVIQHGIAPTDRGTETAGRWKLKEDSSTLEFFAEGAEKPTRTLPIVSIDKDKLVVRK